VKKFGNVHFVDRVTKWPVTTIRLVSHLWLGIGMWGYTPVGITGILVESFVIWLFEYCCNNAITSQDRPAVYTL